MKSNIKTILVPLDFTEKSKNALNVAAKMAVRHEARLIVAHMVHTYYLIDRGGRQVIGSETVQQNISAAQKSLDKIKNRMQSRYGLIIETRIGSQGILDSVNELVYADNVDLIVMGTSGKQKIKQLLLGSNSYSVFVHANCSVLMVPEKFRKTSFKNILFPVRVKNELYQKADMAMLLAAKNKGGINLLGVGDLDKMVTVRKSCMEVRRKLALKSVEYQSQFLFSNCNASVIAKVAKEKGSDLIMLADQDENSWKSVIAENFFKKIINKTEIPLLIVKSRFKRIRNQEETQTVYDLTLAIPG